MGRILPTSETHAAPGRSLFLRRAATVAAGRAATVASALAPLVLDRDRDRDRTTPERTRPPRLASWLDALESPAPNLEDTPTVPFARGARTSRVLPAPGTGDAHPDPDSEDAEDAEDSDDSEDSRAEDSSPARPRRGFADETPAITARANALHLACLPLTLRPTTVFDAARFLLSVVLGVVVPATRVLARTSPPLAATSRASVAFGALAFVAAARSLFAPHRIAARPAAALFLREATRGAARARLRRRVHAAHVDVVARRFVPETTKPVAAFVVARAIVDDTCVRTARSAFRSFRGVSWFECDGFDVARAFLAVASETHQTATFFVACAAFRLACAMLLFRLNAFLTLFDGWDEEEDEGDGDGNARGGASGDARGGASGAGDGASFAGGCSRVASMSSRPMSSRPHPRDGMWRRVVKEHARFRETTRRVAHRHRAFLACATTVVFFDVAVLAYAAGRAWVRPETAARFERGAAVGVLARFLGAAQCARAAVLVTHRTQRVAGFAARRHAERAARDVESGRVDRGFRARDAALGLLREQPLGLRVYGFACDRDFFRGLHMVAVAVAIFVVTRALRAGETDPRVNGTDPRVNETAILA